MWRPTPHQIVSTFLAFLRFFSFVFLEPQTTDIIRGGVTFWSRLHWPGCRLPDTLCFAAPFAPMQFKPTFKYHPNLSLQTKFLEILWCNWCNPIPSKLHQKFISQKVPPNFLGSKLEFVIEILTDHCSGGAPLFPRTAVARSDFGKGPTHYKRKFPKNNFDVMCHSDLQMKICQTFHWMYHLPRKHYPINSEKSKSGNGNKK